MEFYSHSNKLLKQWLQFNLPKKKKNDCSFLRDYTETIAVDEAYLGIGDAHYLMRYTVFRFRIIQF